MSFGHIPILHQNIPCGYSVGLPHRGSSNEYLQHSSRLEGSRVVGCGKVSCILNHRGIQLILAYSWARLDILVADKGRGECFLFLLFLPFHSCWSFFPVPLFHLLYYLFSPFLWETTE